MKFEFFTNEKGDVDVKSPAFSITKVQATLGALITAVAGALPALADASETIKVAAIAAGTLIMLGVFGLAAVDIKTRQRAAEARLRYGSGKTGTADYVALPKNKTLVIQEDHNKVEYEVDMLRVRDGKATLHASGGDGKPLQEDFLDPEQQQ